MNNVRKTQTYSHRFSRIRAIWSPFCLILGFALAAGIHESRGAVSQVVIQASLPGTIYKPTATGTTLTGFACFPQVMAFDIQNSGVPAREILAGWKYRNDGDPNQTYLNFKPSTDGGKTFGTTNTSNANLRSGLKQRNGTLIACQYFTTATAGDPGTTWTFQYETSTDNGANWTTHTATANFSPYNVTGYVNHTGMLEDNSGNLYMVAYGTNYPNPTVQDFIIKSSDGGANWIYWGTPAYDSTRNQSETSVVRCVDNSWLAVFRNFVGSTTGTLRYSRSTDNGVTWTAEQTMVGLTAGSGHVDPELTLLPNGVLVLTYGVYHSTGDRDVRMAFSEDGSGTTWTHDTLIFNSVNGGVESTGYTGNGAVKAHRLLSLGDTGTGWNYGIAVGGSIPSPNPFAVWGKYIDVVLDKTNRLDLKTMYAQGAMTISPATTLTDVNASHPENKKEAAFDGSTDYWSGASATATSGTYQIDLQTTYPITGVGVCLHYNSAETATISLSTNGTTWTPVKQYSTSTIQNAIDYTTFSSTNARYIKVDVQSSGPQVWLNELEVYMDRDTYENNATGVVPFGYTAANGMFTVEDTVSGVTAPIGYQSERALYMNDTSSTLPATVIHNVSTSQATKSLSFRIKPLAYSTSGSAQFAIVSGSTTMYQMAVFADGSVQYYNGSWHQIGTAGAGTVALNAWSLIEVSATTTAATISVNGVSKGTAPPLTTVTTMNGFKFGSAGSAPTGDRALFDEVWMSY